MDPVTMMVASIGMQFFNNYANNKKSKEVQAQQREFQKAAAAHDFDRMRKAQAAAAKLALELEADVHKERLEDIERSYDTLLENFAHSFAISNWSLNVLPFIMKGESFGTLFGGSSKSISMHCILTPSNCQWFNEYFYDDLDLRVEAEMNNNWNAQSSHPIVYYGGGWNRRQNKPNGTSIPSLIDLDDIALLKNTLKQIPTMTITPYFDPYLHFRVQLWGMGKDSEIPFRIDIPHGEIEAKTRIFSYDYYKDDQQELTDDFFNTTMEEFVPYITSLIGFVADKYFWSVYGIQPCLPSYLSDNSIFLEKFYRDKYLTIAKSIVNKNTVNTLKCLKDTSSFIEAISPIVGHASIKELEQDFVVKVQHNYLPIEEKQIPSSYQKTVSFLNEEALLTTSMNWVDINKFDKNLYKYIETEKLDIIKYLQDFQTYIDSKADIFINIGVSLYIEEIGFKTFILHVYDMDTKKILQSYDGFDYLIRTNTLEHNKNVKSVFKYAEHNSIVCRYNRIPKLIERLTDKSLIF